MSPVWQPRFLFQPFCLAYLLSRKLAVWERRRSRKGFQQNTETNKFFKIYCHNFVKGPASLCVGRRLGTDCQLSWWQSTWPLTGQLLPGYLLFLRAKEVSWSCRLRLENVTQGTALFLMFVTFLQMQPMRQSVSLILLLLFAMFWQWTSVGWPTPVWEQGRVNFEGFSWWVTVSVWRHALLPVTVLNLLRPWNRNF